MEKIIVISGLPGSGKSTIAEGIALQLKIPIFSVDPIESAVLKSGLKRSFETGYAAYLVAENLAAEHLKLGMSVIIDAVSPVIQSREMWRGLSERFEADLIIIECVLDRELHKTRIESRVRNIHGIPEVTWEDVESRRKEYLEWTDDRLILDTKDAPGDVIHKAVEYIESKR